MPSEPREESEARERAIPSGKGDREAGRRDEVAEIERIANERVRAGRDEFGRGNRIVSRRRAGIADGPAAQ